MVIPVAFSVILLCVVKYWICLSKYMTVVAIFDLEKVHNFFEAELSRIVFLEKKC